MLSIIALIVDQCPNVKMVMVNFGVSQSDGIAYIRFSRTKKKTNYVLWKQLLETTTSELLAKLSQGNKVD